MPLQEAETLLEEMLRHLREERTIQLGELLRLSDQVRSKLEQAVVALTEGSQNPAFDEMFRRYGWRLDIQDQ